VSSIDASCLLACFLACVCRLYHTNKQAISDTVCTCTCTYAYYWVGIHTLLVVHLYVHVYVFVCMIISIIPSLLSKTHTVPYILLSTHCQYRVCVGVCVCHPPPQDTGADRELIVYSHSQIIRYWCPDHVSQYQ
jgi:hypothetical protein